MSMACNRVDRDNRVNTALIRRDRYKDVEHYSNDLEPKPGPS